MRVFLILIAVAVLGWSGYWVIGSRSAAQDARNWFAERRADGWQANYGDVRTQGFPNRFDTTITAPALHNPDTSLRWAAPFFQILRLSYKPEHLILVFPENQAMETASHDIAIVSEKMQASAVFYRDEAGTLDRATLATSALTLVINDLSLRVSTVLLALKLEPSNFYTVAADLRDISVAPDGMSFKLDTLRADTKLFFDAPLQRPSLISQMPTVTEIEIREFEITQGRLSISATGTLRLDPQARASGRLTIQIANWQELLGNGPLPNALLQNLRKIFGDTFLQMSDTAITARVLQVEATLRDGAISLGAMTSVRD